MWVFEPFRLDGVNQCLWRGNARIALKPKAFAVLQYLVTHAGRLVTPGELLGAIWPDTFVQPEVLRQYILEIRRVLGDRAEAPEFIRTLPKRGWEFIAGVSDESFASSAAGGARPTPLVGRAAALNDLDGYLSRALGGRRQVVFVVGEAGIGKTYLMDAYQRTAAGVPALHVARGHSVEGFSGKEAYYPILEALAQFARGPVGVHVVNTLEKHAPTWMIQFPAFVRRDQQAALQREILGATRERMVRELCEALEVMTAAAAVVIILEDLHRADHSTLDAISAIARRREPAKLLLIGTLRPADVILSDSPLKVLKQDLVVHRLAAELPLERLTEADVAEFVAAALAARDLPRELATVIHRHSDGNPLFMTAMLDHLVQQHVLAQVNGRWRLTVPLDAVDPGAPETLTQMLEMQLYHANEGQRRLLECASVAGYQFTAWSVATMLGQDQSAVEVQCDGLAERQQFLKARGTRALPNGASTPELMFSHALYREVLYRRLNQAERRKFHRRLADGLEGLRSPVDPELAAELALHCEEGGEYERAVRYLLLAAQNAAHRYAHREAIRILDHARELLPKMTVGRASELDVQILARIGRAHLELGEMARSAATYDAAATRAGGAGLLAEQAGILLGLTHPAAFADPDRCAAACEQVAQIGALRRDAVLEAQGTMLAAGWRILLNGWRTEDAQTYATALADLHRFGGDVNPFMNSRIQVLHSNYREAFDSAGAALLKVTEADGLWDCAPLLSAKAIASLYLGRLGEAQRTVLLGIELADKNHNATWLGIFRSYLAWIRSQLYDFDGVRELSNAVSAVDAAQAPPRTRLLTNMFQGLADLAAGQQPTTFVHFEDVRDSPIRPKSIQSWYWRAYARLGLSEAWLASANVANANREAQALVETVTSWKESFLKSLAWDLSARIALKAAHQKISERYIRQALEIVESVEVPLASWQVHATAWDVYRKTNPKKAEDHRSKAKAIILQIADALEEFVMSRQAFLSAARVRRILENTPLRQLRRSAASRRGPTRA
jgi:DNA-binding winged helix-turn-helix (wHTH) protein